MQTDARTAILTDVPVAYWDGPVGGSGELLDATLAAFHMYPNGGGLTGQTGADGTSTTAVDILGDVSPNNHFYTVSDVLSANPWDQWTIGAWVYARTYPAGSGILMDALNFDSVSAGALGADLDSGSDVLAGGAYNSFWAYAIDPGGSFPTNVWVHVVATCDAFSTDGITLYIDGAKVSDSSGSIAGYGLYGEFMFLGYNDFIPGSNPFWPGLIDQPHVFNYALTALQIANHYAAMNLPPSGSSQTISNVGGIASAAAFGAAGVELNVSPAGIASGELVGTPALEQQVSPVGIMTSEAFGTPTVTGGTPPPYKPGQLPTLSVG